LVDLKQDSAVLEKVMKVVKTANAQDFISDVSDLALVLGEGGKGLSGGQKQRVTIARALYKGPKILLLDEVTSALDPISERVAQDAIDKLTQGRTVLIVAHRLHTIINSDLIIIMDKGNVLAQGKHEELLKNCEKYRQMINASADGSIGTKSAEETDTTIPEDLQLLTSHVYSNLHRFEPKLEKEFKKRLEAIIPDLKKKDMVPLSIEDSTSEFVNSGSWSAKSFDKFTIHNSGSTVSSDDSGFEPNDPGFESLAINLKKTQLTINDDQVDNQDS